MYVTMSISIGLYPNLDLWNANKLHYITINIHFNTRNSPVMNKRNVATFCNANFQRQ